MIKAILLLGNPGKDYEGTRHNAGTLCINSLQTHFKFSTWNKKFNTEFASAGPLNSSGEKVHIARSLGYMNLCGQDFRPLLDFFKIQPASVLAIHDDLETPYGTIKFKEGGGHGGHNGLRNLDQVFGTQQYFRVKIGIGRPKHGDPASYVLSRFTKDEEAVWSLIADAVAKLAAEACAVNLSALKQLTLRYKDIKCFQGA